MDHLKEKPWSLRCNIDDDDDDEAQLDGDNLFLMVMRTFIVMQ